MINNIYEEEFNQKVLNSDKTVVVDFYATWCGPCKMLSPIMEELSNEYDDVEFYKINVDDNQNIATTYNVSSIPNVQIFKNGECVQNSIGFKPKNEIAKLIESVR